MPVSPVEGILPERICRECTDCLQELADVQPILSAWERTGYNVGQFRERIEEYRKRLEAIKREFFPTMP